LQYTDGVTEAMTAERDQFGEKRLLEALSCSASTDPVQLLPHIRSRIDAFVAGADQFDDITMLALRYNGAGKV
ncbi:MAG: SpoIIE family protein phosphatase, partial [Firmicutes bacterium]|nr:SpoIIE family protein phosphatase [Bacillota bacterium]